MNHLANHLWQSTVFAAAVALATMAMRRNSARLRYWLWLAASLKFLIPFFVAGQRGRRSRKADRSACIARPHSGAGLHVFRPGAHFLHGSAYRSAVVPALGDGHDLGSGSARLVVPLVSALARDP